MWLHMTEPLFNIPYAVNEVHHMDNKTAFGDWLLQEALRVICFVFVFVFTKAALKRAAIKENENEKIR